MLERDNRLVCDWNHSRPSNTQVLTAITNHAAASRLQSRPCSGHIYIIQYDTSHILESHTNWLHRRYTSLQGSNRKIIGKVVVHAQCTSISSCSAKIGGKQWHEAPKAWWVHDLDHPLAGFRSVYMYCILQFVPSWHSKTEMHRRWIHYFSLEDESFQAINCTDTDNQTIAERN